MSTRFNVAQLYSEGQDAKIAALEAEVATLRRRIDFFGCPEKICLLCGKEGPCGLKYPDDDTGTAICQYDKTYPEMIAIAHAAEAEVAQLRRALKAAQSIMWMAKEYADGGGERGPEMRDYNEAETIMAAAAEKER